MRFWIKIHLVRNQKIVAICDEEILGKEFEYKGVKIKVNESFYKGILIDERELDKYLQSFNSLNAFGKNIVNELLKRKLISEKNILIIDDEKYVQIFKI